jgi:hypothetical protein
MPSALRAQVALIGLLAVLLIPIGTSSLRGLTHILTCQEDSATAFTVDVPVEGAPTITSSAPSIERNEDGTVDTNELCGGLILDVLMGSRRAERADVTLAITNNSEYGWRGSVQVRLDGTLIPIDIGNIDAGETATDDFELRLDAGESYAIEGKLLIGP